MVAYNYHMSVPPYQAPRGEYAKYYAASQFGGGAVLPAFAGVQRQRGHGFFGSLVRMGMPLLKTIGRAVAPRVLTVGKRVLKDAIAGKNIKTSLKNRSIGAAKELAGDLFNTAVKRVSTYKTTDSEAPPAKRARAAQGRRRGENTQKRKGKVSGSKVRSTLF